MPQSFFSATRRRRRPRLTTQIDGRVRKGISIRTLSDQYSRNSAYHISSSGRAKRTATWKRVPPWLPDGSVSPAPGRSVGLHKHTPRGTACTAFPPLAQQINYPTYPDHHNETIATTTHEHAWDVAAQFNPQSPTSGHPPSWPQSAAHPTSEPKRHRRSHSQCTYQ